MGGRRQLLAAEEPAGDQLLVRHFASIFGDDPIGGREQAREAGTRGHRRVPHRVGRDRRRRHRDQARRGSTNGVTLAANMEAFKKVPTISGMVSFSAKCHSVFGRQYRVIKIQDNKATRRRHGHCQGRSEDLTQVDGRSTGRAARRPGATLRASTVSRAFEGVQALRGVTLELRPRRGGRADRPERRRQVDPRQRAQRLRPPDEGGVTLGGERRHRAGRRTAAAATDSRGRSSMPLVSRPLRARERRGVGARRRRVAREATRRADALLGPARARPLRRHARRGARARRRAPARRRARPRHRAALRAARRAAAGLPEAEVPDFAARRPLDRAPTTAPACS